MRLRRPFLRCGWSAGRKRGPAIRIDCGEDDFLIDHNRVFHQTLKTLGVAHEYAEYPGAHSWDYWDLRIQEALTWHAAQLGLAI